MFYLASTLRDLENIPTNYHPLADPMMDLLKSRIFGLSIIIKFYRRLASYLNKNVQITWYKRAFFAKQSILKEKYDLIISVSSPFITHLTALEYRKK